jgi:glucose-6-phosphate-specific signal transduction histidine kinase
LQRENPGHTPPAEHGVRQFAGLCAPSLPGFGIQADYWLSDGLRHISHELHPGMLELFGLVTALRSHCEEFSTVTSIPVEFESDCTESVPADAALCIYRIAQESLRNAAKYSRATRVHVSLKK